MRCYSSLVAAVLDEATAVAETLRVYRLYRFRHRTGRRSIKRNTELVWTQRTLLMLE